MLRGKKGSITDLPFIIAGVFSVIVVAILVTYIVSNINTEWQEMTWMDEFDKKNLSRSASTKMSDDIPNVMNGGILLIFFGAVAVSFILAAMIPMHPAFFVIYIFEWLILVWLGGGIANAYQLISESAVLSSTMEQFTLATHFFRYFPFVVGVVGILLAIVMYKVRKGFLEG